MHERPLFQMIDFDNAQGAALVEELAAEHGPALAAARVHASRIFAMRSPVAPGLCFVGAQAAHRWTEGAVAAEGVSTIGGATNLAGATAGALAEVIERLSQFERPGDVVATGPIETAGARLAADGDLLMPTIDVEGTARDAGVDWVRGHDLATGVEVRLPADWVLRRQNAGPLTMPGTALSTGVAAGRTFADAALRAVLELIERDATALWWIGGRRGRAMSLAGDAVADAARLLRSARAERRDDRPAWMIDVTSDVGVPTVVAISTAPDGRRMARGMAARLALDEAASAAIVEMCQSELGLLVTEAKLEQRGAEALNAVDRLHLARADAIDAGHCELLHPVGVPRQHRHPDAAGAEGELGRLGALLAVAAVGVTLVDLTRAEFGLAVVAAVAPRLQRLPSDVRTVRLSQVIAETGGAAHWTGGLALL